jgi:hypothetical protein
MSPMGGEAVDAAAWFRLAAEVNFRPSDFVYRESRWADVSE